jgi:hypothetical protein
MSVTLAWDAPDQSILRLIYERNWTQKDFQIVLSQLASVLNSLQHSVHIIIDQEQAEVSPGVFLNHAKSLCSITDHPNAGVVVVVGASDAARELCEMAANRHSFCHNLRFAPILEDAHNILYHLDFVANINNLLPDDWPR